GARGEGLVGAGDDDRADVVVGLEAVERGGDFVHHLVVECVHRLGAIQGDEADPAPLLGDDEFERHTFSWLMWVAAGHCELAGWQSLLGWITARTRPPGAVLGLPACGALVAR